MAKLDPSWVSTTEKHTGFWRWCLECQQEKQEKELYTIQAGIRQQMPQ